MWLWDDLNLFNMCFARVIKAWCLEKTCTLGYNTAKVEEQYYMPSLNVRLSFLVGDAFSPL
jgi:hypothetical protein